MTAAGRGRAAAQVVAAALILGGVAAGAYLTGQVTAQRALVTTDEINTVEVARQARPAVVKIEVQIQKDMLQPGDKPTDVGSGFFYKDELIVTNYHVIQYQDGMSVILHNGRRVPATVEGVDPGIDVAILRVPGVKAPRTLQFGNSAALLPGQKLITVGSPLEIPNFVGTGVFSVFARGDQIPRDDDYGREIGQYIMSTANIQGGNSGGPVLDSRGLVVGVADANAAPNSFVPGVIGLAIPGDLVRQSLDDLERTGVSQRGNLGVTFVDLEDLDPVLRQLAGLVSNRGVLVDETVAGSAAGRAGVRGSLRNSRGQLMAPLGDIIVAVDGRPVASAFEVTSLVAAKRPGQVVTLTVWREGKRENIPVTLQQRTAEGGF
ncbi:S1C family serine protease [Deinococcus lacus]|uniref:S1C family serine protease n=1 Tax=Deinococcus lacus TaxID=392561 RepID=A0ABW1YFC6_9DEIO